MQGVILTLLICSVTMSALVLLYIALTPFLAKRYSVTGRYYTWLVIVAGLIIPFRPHFRNAVVKVDMPGYMSGPVIWTGNAAPALIPATTEFSLSLSTITWWQIAAAVWLVGMAAFLSYHLIRHYRFLKLTARWSENITDEETLQLFHEMKAQMGVSSNIDLQICDSIGSPMMLGFVNPRILLPRADFSKDELSLILKHEIVHYKRKDLWYKCFVLIAAAIHWFNPIVHLMTKVIGIQCELSCDAKVVHGMDADTRFCYSKTIIGVVRYKSKLKTALSTSFYGGKKDMKTRIFSIMDMSKKKVGAVVLGAALVLTVGTGAALAANPSVQTRELTVPASRIPVAMSPNPDIYAPYAAFGLTISADGTKLLYEGQTVRLFADEKSDTEAFYLNEDGTLNLSAVRNGDGGITGIDRITAQEAQKYYEDFFAEEIDPEFFHKVQAEDIVKENAMESFQEGGNKYEKYQPFGIAYSAADEILYFKGQRVKFFIDQSAEGNVDAMWKDDAGTVNVAVIRDASGQITGIESITDDKAQE